MMKKKTAILIISYLSVAVILLGAFSVVQTVRVENARRTARYEGEHAFGELCAAVAGMDHALEKSLYAVSPGMTAALCAEIQARALAASAALGELPFATQELEQTAGFLSRTGDYTAYLLRQAAAGVEPTPEDLENLRSLSDTAGLLEDNLLQLRSDMAGGLVEMDEATLESGLPSFSDSFLNMEQEFPETPSLVYDGPFSQSVADRQPRLLEGAREVSQEEALLIAAGFLGIRPNLVSSAGLAGGKIPVWRAVAGDRSVYVTMQGGHVLRAISGRPVQRTVLPLEDGLEAARAVLSAAGLSSMEESYHVLQDNILTVTFCHRQDGVICYPDMVKIAVAMDDGSLAGYDAEAYITSHGDRDMPEAEVDPEEAGALVSPELTVLSQRLAVIPSAGAEELLCREFICENRDGQHYLLYVNAVTGQQERILILLEDENGTLAI